MRDIFQRVPVFRLFSNLQAYYIEFSLICQYYFLGFSLNLGGIT
nr:MAG TPA: hypothetical protein [Caudoviricetes sp.]DAU62218.1 MAG TPA: hypothetical protein [Caudoviricetes sp.]